MFGAAQNRILFFVTFSAFISLTGAGLPGFTEDANSVLGPSARDLGKAESLFIKGHGALDKRNLKGAEACYRKAIELNPGDSRYHRQLAMLLLQEGRGHEAEREALCATKADPSDWKSFIALGRVYHAANRIDEEVTVYKKILAILPAEEKEVRAKIEEFIRRDEESVKKERERLKKKKEFEEREFKNAY